MAQKAIVPRELRMNERKSKQNRKINFEKPLVYRSNVEEKSKIENRNWIEN